MIRLIDAHLDRRGLVGANAYRLACVTAVAAAVLLVLVNQAVGFLGSEDNAANRLFIGVIALAALGALTVRFRARGMATVLVATAVAQLAVGGFALGAGLASPGWKGVYEVALGSTLFTSLWLTAACLFRRAA